MVEHVLAKDDVGVRFSLPAPEKSFGKYSSRTFFWSKVRPPRHFGNDIVEARRPATYYMFTVYILQSLKDNRTYVGQTNNLDDRLLRHNTGQVRATKYRRPLKVIFQETFESRQAAMARELWWKSSSGRKKMKELFK